MTKDSPRTSVLRDAELIARLRDWMEHDEGKINDAREKAADRIEALTAKLAKAVEALDAAANWADRYRWAAPWVDDARTTLAEIKGESHE